MSLYTAIVFTPRDRTWVAPPELIRGIAVLLGVRTFDHFSVYHEVSSDSGLDDDERYERIISGQKIPIEEGLGRLRADRGYWTHMMFPYADFMKCLMAEVAAALPESLSRDFAPWDTSFYSGHWAIQSYDDGTLTDSGVCAFKMSANGRPSDSAAYLKSFLEVEGVKKLQGQLEALSNQPWTAVIDLT